MLDERLAIPSEWFWLFQRYVDAAAKAGRPVKCESSRSRPNDAGQLIGP